MTIPTYYLAARDFGHFGWDAIGAASDDSEARDLITESFRDDTICADLETVQVWHITAGAAPRDVTEDLLTQIGAAMSLRHDALSFPDAFLTWANSDIQDAAAVAREVDWQREDRNERMREEAA